MNRRSRRNEQIEKKNEIKTKKDRGDLKSIISKKIDNNQMNNGSIDQIIYPDGDSRKVSTSIRPENIKLNVIVKLPNDQKTKQAEPEKIVPIKKGYDRDSLNRALSDLKRIREKYNLKQKSSSVPASQVKKDVPSKDNSVKSEKNVSKDILKEPPLETLTKEKEKPIEPNNEEGKEKKETTPPKKMPIIKTITTQSGSMRVYKAVTFVEQKPPTSLKINIPDIYKKQNASKETDTSFIKCKPTVSRVSVKGKPAIPKRRVVRKRERKNIKHSPSKSSIRGNRSPSTEVAKWAPSSITRDTKPYYEAWVNTTLAAVSKGSKKDKLLLKKQPLLTIERPETPDLVYSLATDEKYTGRIKITQR